MTLTIEVNDDKALNELKDFLKNKNEIRLVKDEHRDTDTGQPGHTSQKEMTENVRLEKIRSLQGSLNMSPERIKQLETYLQETRNELE